MLAVNTKVMDKTPIYENSIVQSLKLVMHLLVLMALQCSQGLLIVIASLNYPCLFVGLPYCIHIFLYSKIHLKIQTHTHQLIMITPKAYI